VKWLAVIFALLLPLSACKSGDTSSAQTFESNPKDAPNDKVLASIGSDRITQSEIQPVLMEAYGLNVLLKFVELHLVREEAEKEHIVIAQADIDAERQLTMQMLKRAAQEQTVGVGGASTQSDDVEVTAEEADQLLDRALAMQQVSRAEFNHCLLEVNATLRKLAEPTIEPLLTEEAVHEQFNQTYGEKAIVHYVIMQNMVEAQSLEQDLASGKTFEEAAQAKGQDVREFQPFSRVSAEIPDVIRQVVFSLKTGQVSDPVQINQYILVMKLMDLIPPQHAKYEDYKDSVRKALHDQKLKEAMNKLNVQLAKNALETMVIYDPVLQKQWEQRQAANNVQTESSVELRRQMDKVRAQAAQAATVPSAPNPFATTPAEVTPIPVPAAPSTAPAAQ
jgi:hypothetical protein